jgi:hypothetical protein
MMIVRHANFFLKNLSKIEKSLNEDETILVKNPPKEREEPDGKPNK